MEVVYRQVAITILKIFYDYIQELRHIHCQEEEERVK